MANLEGEFADFAVAEYNANPQFIEGIIAKGEGALQAFLVGVFQNVHVNGIAGIILLTIEGGVKRFVASLIAKYTPQEIYTLLGQILANEAKHLGG